MTSAQFNVVVDGQLLPGFDHDTVLMWLQQQLKLTETKARQLLAGNSIVVKRDVSAEIADAYCKRLLALGLNAHRVAIAPAAATTGSTSENYFDGVSIPLPAIGNRGQYQRALYRTIARLLGIVGVYSALTVFTVAMTVFFALHFGYLLAAPPILFSATIFLLPLLALLGVCALLLRPFLSMATLTSDAVAVRRAEQPQLFAFVEQLCAALALKAPDEIALNAQSHIAIEPLPGIKNLWANNYRLILGLPLLDVCNMQIFSALLAADLRTRATPAGLRYTGLLLLIRHRAADCMVGTVWLHRKISALQTRTQRLEKLFDLTRILFAQSNQFLQKFSTRAEIAAVQFARALFLEHDRYLTKIGGASALDTALLIEEKLTSAARDAIAKNTEDRIDAGLVDNLPAFIKHYYDSLDDKFERELRRRWETASAARRDEPPIARERLEQIVAEPGLITSTEPAQTLLENAAASAGVVTQQAYRAAGNAFVADALLSIDDLTYAATQDILQRQQAVAYFNNWFKPFRFWKLAEYKLIRDMPLQDAAEQLSVCVNEIRRLSPDRFKLLADYARLQTQLFEILIAQHVLAAGKPYAFRYVTYEGTTLQPILEERQQLLNAVVEKLAQQEAVMGGRITLGLRLCGQAENDVVDLHDAMRLLHDSGARLQKLVFDVYQLEQLLRRHYQQREADYSAPIKRLEEKIRDAGTLLLVRLNDIPCPLDSRHHSLKSYVEAALEQLSGSESKSPTAQRARRLLDVLFEINEKLSLLAADYGTTAEEAYRIEPIKLVATTD